MNDSVHLFSIFNKNFKNYKVSYHTKRGNLTTPVCFSKINNLKTKNNWNKMHVHNLKSVLNKVMKPQVSIRDGLKRDFSFTGQTVKVRFKSQ